MKDKTIPKVLIIAPQPFFANRGTPINVAAMAETLGAAGYAVDLLVFPVGAEKDIPGTSIIRCSNPLRFKSVPVGISWKKIVLDFLMFSRALRLHLTNRYAVIHGIEEGGVIAFLLTRFKSAKCIYDVDSDIPDQLRDRPFFGNKLSIGLVRSIENVCLRKADAVITVCPFLTSHVRLIAPNTVVYEIRDFPVQEDVETQTQVFRDKFALENRRLILYTGNFKAYQGLELLVNAVSGLRSVPEFNDVLLILVGGGPEEKWDIAKIKTLVSRLKLDEGVKMLGAHPLAEMPAFMQMADVLVSPRVEGVNTPLKIYSYLDSGKPVVATSVPSHTQVLDSSVAFLCDPNPDSLKLALAAALDSSAPAVRRKTDMAAKARALVAAKCSKKIFQRKLLGTYASTTNSSPARLRETEVTVLSEPAEVLVTGAGGFVGTRLVQTLIEQGTAVRAMVRNPSQAATVQALGAEVTVADITQPDSMRECFSGIRQVYHIAALFRKAGLPDSAFENVNINGVRNVFEAAIANKCSKIVHCSTVGVHGDVQHPPGTEETPFSPGDIYQRTKLEGENLAKDYFLRGDIDGAIIRPAMIYGPGDTRTLKLFKNIARRRFFYVGSGNSLVHFVDVRDLAKGFILAMEKSPVPGSTYILAGREARPLKEVAELIAGYFGVKPPSIHLPVRPLQELGGVCEMVCAPFGIEPPIFRRRVDFFTKNRSFSWSKAKDELGYEPRLSLENEIEEICTWYVFSGLIDRARQNRGTSTIIRDLDGNINFWDIYAESKYGWNSEQAVGAVSHDLLRTEFPTDLESINRQLEQDRVWEGELVHATRCGTKIRVHSRWEFIEQADDQVAILEKNTLIESDGTRKRDTSMIVPFYPTIESIVAELTPFL